MLTVPAGSVVTVERTGAEGAGMLDVIWNNRRIMMFAQDLRTRGELIPSQAA